ncbi:MAG TPA: M67 family metallopeptidase [Sphingomonas sp.]|nr:M67 family metallopeptidase [Sphingomonas sp.]
MKTEISRTVLDAIQSHAATEPAREVCGLLFGGGGRIDAATPAENVAEEPGRRFEIDPAALIAAMRAERAGGPKLLGYYHSHPNGPPEPSATDRAFAATDGRLWLIIARGEIAAWKAGEGGFEPVELVSD